REVAEDTGRERDEIAALSARGRAVAEREGEQRHEDRDRKDEESRERCLLLEEQRVRAIALGREHHSVEDQHGDGADVDEHLERRDRLRTEQHEHAGHAQEGERHEQRRAGDALQKDDADGRSDDAHGEQREEDRLDEAERHAAARDANRARNERSRLFCRYGTAITKAPSISQFAIATGRMLVGNASRRVAVTSRFSSVSGMSIFQQKDMSWSTRKRGSVARIHMNTSTKK